VRCLRCDASDTARADPRPRPVLRGLLPALLAAGADARTRAPGDKAVKKGAPTSTRDLRPSERCFLSAMQQLRHGWFESVRIQRGELVLDPWPTTVSRGQVWRR